MSGTTLRYIVGRTPSGQVTCDCEDGTGVHPVAHVVHHSPTGFETGYAGSGPADLALSIMADLCGVGVKQMTTRIHGFEGWNVRADFAAAWYQDFKDWFLARQQVPARADFSITQAEIIGWIHKDSARSLAWNALCWATNPGPVMQAASQVFDRIGSAAYVEGCPVDDHYINFDVGLEEIAADIARVFRPPRPPALPGVGPAKSDSQGVGQHPGPGATEGQVTRE